MRKVMVLIICFLLVACSSGDEKLIEEAEALVAQGDHQGAIILYEKVLRNEVNPEILFIIGDLYEESEQSDLAIETYESLLKEDDHDQARKRLMNLYIEKGEDFKVIEMLEEGDQNIVVLEELISLYLETDQIEKAELKVEVLLKLDPLNRKALIKKAEWLVIDGDIEEAIKLYTLILEQHPGDITASKAMDELSVPTVGIKDVGFIMSVSSTLKEMVGDTVRIYDPSLVFDEDEASIWAEGHSGNGENEWMMFESDQPFNLESISISNGFTRDEGIYYKNNRALSIRVETNVGHAEAILIDGQLDLQTFQLGFEDVTTIKIIFLDIAQGSVYNDLCISELRFNDQVINVEVIDRNIVDTTPQYNSESACETYCINVKEKLVEGEKVISTSYDVEGIYRMVDYFVEDGLIRKIYLGDSWYDSWYYYDEKGNLVYHYSFDSVPNGLSIYFDGDKLIKMIAEDPSGLKEIQYYFNDLSNKDKIEKDYVIQMSDALFSGSLIEGTQAYQDLQRYLD